MLIPILIVVLALVVLLLVVIALRPSQFSVSRSGTVAAPSDAVFEQVNDLHNWEGWSPWAKLDPAAKGTYEGPSAGVGASFAWAGNRNIGEGRMTITESRPYDLVRFKLDFLKPFKGTNTAEFTFKPEGSQTRVTWTMSGHNSFFAKAIGLVINCNDMIGKQFEKGLEQLNLVTQTAGKR
jgi:hypothetical protein